MPLLLIAPCIAALNFSTTPVMRRTVYVQSACYLQPNTFFLSSVEESFTLGADSFTSVTRNETGVPQAMVNNVHQGVLSSTRVTISGLLVLVSARLQPWRPGFFACPFPP